MKQKPRDITLVKLKISHTAGGKRIFVELLHCLRNSEF